MRKKKEVQISAALKCFWPVYVAQREPATCSSYTGEVVQLFILYLKTDVSSAVLLWNNPLQVYT